VKKITIEAVPQEYMRAPYHKETRAGDWWFDENGDMVIRTTGTDLDDNEAFLYALHELIEARLCAKAGISQDAVDRFDAAFDNMEDRDPEGEPGDHPAAPYRRQHRQACIVEFMVADMLGMIGYGSMR